jgi:hypothetical protein
VGPFRRPAFARARGRRAAGAGLRQGLRRGAPAEHLPGPLGRRHAAARPLRDQQLPPGPRGPGHRQQHLRGLPAGQCAGDRVGPQAAGAYHLHLPGGAARPGDGDVQARADRHPVGLPRHPAVPLHAAAPAGQRLQRHAGAAHPPHGLDAPGPPAHRAGRRHAGAAGDLQQHLLPHRRHAARQGGATARAARCAGAPAGGAEHGAAPGLPPARGGGAHRAA